ncbi:MAG: hypothetical protein II739_02130, partial [Clostridia bacterium]|nr:hypothetical protein [Clostridia bacterium]
QAAEGGRPPALKGKGGYIIAAYEKRKGVCNSPHHLGGGNCDYNPCDGTVRVPFTIIIILIFIEINLKPL